MRACLCRNGRPIGLTRIANRSKHTKVENITVFKAKRREDVLQIVKVAFSETSPYIPPFVCVGA